MIPDPHAQYQSLIDEMLTTRDPASAAPQLRDHLQTCAACRAYLDTTMRAIAALNSFSFPVDPALPVTITASLRRRAAQLESTQLSTRTALLATAAALALTLAGSFIDLRLSGLLAALLDLQRAHVQQGLMTFWIGPSVSLLLLFPLLPLLGRRKQGAR